MKTSSLSILAHIACIVYAAIVFISLPLMSLITNEKNTKLGYAFSQFKEGISRDNLNDGNQGNIIGEYELNELEMKEDVNEY